MQRYQKLTQKPKPKKLKESLNTVIPYYNYIQTIIGIIIFSYIFYKFGIIILTNILLNFDREIVVGKVTEEFNTGRGYSGKMYLYEITVDSSKYERSCGNYDYMPGDTIMVEYVPGYPILNRPAYFRD